MKYLLAAAVILLAACTSSTPTPAPSPVTSAVCAIETTVATTLASAINSTLTCSNQGQIQTDLIAALGKANLCSQPAVVNAATTTIGPVASIVCPLAVSAAMSAVSGQVPAAWGCSGSNSSLSAVLTTACEGVVPLQKKAK